MDSFDDYFMVRHIDSETDSELIDSFHIKHKTGKGLEEYIKVKAIKDEEFGLMRTYLLIYKDTNECVAYFSLKSGLISVQNYKTEDDNDFDTIPGIEIANFAINDGFKEKYGINFKLGNYIIQKCVLPIIKDTAKQVGVCILYIFSLPIKKVMDNYSSMGFKFLSKESEEFLNKRVKPMYDKSCRFMFYPLKSR